MPDGAPAGTSFADAIDLDASSGSDRADSPVILWPPSRPSGAALQKASKDQYREAQRIESDSPPPLIVASNIRTAPHPNPPPPSSSNQQQPPTMTTQQRLRAALNPRIGVQTTPIGLQPSPIASLPTSSSQGASSAARQRAQQRASISSPHSAAEPALANRRLPSPTSYLNGKMLHHEIFCRLVVEIKSKPEYRGRLVHSQLLKPKAIPTGRANPFWEFRLVATHGSSIGQWDSPAASLLQKMVTSNKLMISLRYIDPAAISSPPDLLSPGKSYAFLDVQYPRHGKFSQAYVHQLPICPLSELGVEMSTLLPSQLHPYHFRDLAIILTGLKQGPIVPQVAQAAAAVAGPSSSAAVPADGQTASVPTQGWNSYLQAAVDAASSLSSAIGLTSDGNAAALASMIAQGIYPAAAPQLPGTWRTAANLMARNNFPGSLPPSILGQGLDEDELLFQMAAHSAFDDEGEPMDADMREILSNMTDGTFHGTDALATLYGDKGIDVGKLDLYSDVESLKQRGLKTPLHDHQLQGLQWIIKAEHRRVSKRDGKIRGLWRTNLDSRGRPYYYNLASRKCRRTIPVLPRGGINSDSMGLGKTIQIIATCLADRNRVPKGIKPLSGPVDSKPSSQNQPSTSAQPDKGKDRRKENEDDDDEFDSEEDYKSGCEDGEDSDESDLQKPKKTKLSLKRMASTDSSDTEEESDVVMEEKKTQQPVAVDARAVKSETVNSSETEEEDNDDEPVRGSGKRKIVRKESVEEARDMKRQKSNDGVKVKAEEAAKEKSKKKTETKKNGKASKEKTDEYNEATLVICPLSVLQNWTGQVDEHCDKKKVRYYTYHGDMAKYIRKRDAFETILGRYTFVFTTYDTVRQEYRVIQKRREAAEKKAAAEEEKRRKEAEGDSAKTTPSVEEVMDEEKPMIQRKGKDSVSRGTSEESEYKSAATTEDEDIKPEIKAKGKGKAKSKSRAKSTGRDWYDSDDSLFAEEMDEMETVDDPREIPLFGVKWRRIVLDEAHICRNPRTQLYNAICELKGERRWAVTGTPIVNSTKDLGTLAAWCGLQPFAENPKEWTRAIERPLKKANQSEQAAGLLRKVVTSICLRRNKSMKNPQGEPIVKLPEVKFYKHTIPLTTADRDYYSKCEAACREHLSRWADEGNLQRHQSAILTFLLRLRQMSCHRRLIGSKLLEEIQNKDWDSVDKTEGYTKVLSKKAIEDLQAKLKVHVEMNDDCPICFESLMSQDKEPVITPCGHPFCKECLGAIVGRHMVNTARCPMDRLPLPSMEHMIEMPVQEMTPTADEIEDVEEESSEKTSAKVRECMKIIRATLKKDPTEKILVFSNFVKFLNIIQEEVKEAEISHARFNGSLDVKRRDAVLKSFCKPINPRQSVGIQKTLGRLEEKLQREKEAEKVAAEKKAAERAAAASSDGPAAPPSEASHSSSSSSLLNSLRTVDRDIKSVGKTNGRGKQRAQDDDIVGENPSVLLISMGCGALGLNLTVASTVLLMDPWWQSSLEQQSLDRTHRIGQKRDVKVFQIIAESTVEARMLEIQATKEGLAETAFSGMRATGSTSDRRTKVETNIKDLVRLFGLSSEETQQLTARSAAVAARRN